MKSKFSKIVMTAVVEPVAGACIAALVIYVVAVSTTHIEFVYQGF